MNRRVVLLVDDRKRDLAVATLIAHQLEAAGVECLLEPLEAYRAVLAAWRPSMIIFNHLNASHLVEYSKRLAELGVLTAVLPNEGIVYNEDQLRFVAGQHHSGAHIDYFFCWNRVHRDALVAEGVGEHAQVELVGVPRFDFYFEPWSRVFRAAEPSPRRRPRILLCTNFMLAKFHDLPRAQAEKFFAAWKDRNPIYRDYWRIVEDIHYASRRVFEFADALVATDRYELVLRPHPREHDAAYLEWLARLPPGRREWARLDSTSNITTLILGCDLEISCEMCTTALESWIAGKPTVELEFRKNPALWFAEHSAANTPCDSPQALPGIVERLLREAEAPDVLAARRRHLEKWCGAPDGTSSARMARVIAEAVQRAPQPDWSRLDVADKRRGAKLHLLRRLGRAYHFDPLMALKMRVNPTRYAIKNFAYQKSIKPADVAASRDALVRALSAP